MADPCTVCVPTANENYTLHTFDLRICIPDDPSAGGPGGWYDVGDIQTGGFKPVEEILDHYRGQTGELDASMITKRHWEITAEMDEITARNLSILTGGAMTNVVGGCEIPLLGAGAIKLYAGELVHTFPNGTKTLTIGFWSAAIVGDWELGFSDTWSSYTMTIKSFKCDLYPDKPYGYILFNEACPTS